MEIESKACCVFGHRKVENAEELKIKLRDVIERLITEENVNTFYLGSKSEFDTLCREVLAEKKQVHSHIKRIYVRAEFENISYDYEQYLLQECEETYFSERAKNAGKAAYVERNREMIDKSHSCIVYYKEEYLPPKRMESKKDLFLYQPKSGTAVAYRYALQKKRNIINLAE